MTGCLPGGPRALGPACPSKHSSPPIVSTGVRLLLSCLPLEGLGLSEPALWRHRLSFLWGLWGTLALGALRAPPRESCPLSLWALVHELHLPAPGSLLLFSTGSLFTCPLKPRPSGLPLLCGHPWPGLSCCTLLPLSFQMCSGRSFDPDLLSPMGI